MDARHAYDLWIQLVRDEALYRGEVKLEGEDQHFIESLLADPGTRWNVENLRYRAADEVSAKLLIYLPRTMKMLTRGDESWLRDIVYEYVAFFRWHEFGHYHLKEVARFADYVHTRIGKRRPLPPHLEVVLHFESSLARLLAKTKGAAWPEPRLIGDRELLAARPRWGVAEMIDLQADIGEWIISGDPLSGEVRPGPLTMLAFVPSPLESYRLQRLGEGARAVFDLARGERTTEEIAAALELDPLELLPVLRRMLAEKSLSLG